MSRAAGDISGSRVELDLFDPATNDCPYHAYRRLREEAPIWQDPLTGQYMVTRYADVRAILLDTERFSNEFGGSDDLNHFVKAVRPTDPEKARRQLLMARQVDELQKLYEEEGVVTAPHVQALDDPKHMQVRRLFDVAFRREGLAERETVIVAEVDRLIDAFLPRGRCEFLAEFAVPLPLRMQAREVGITSPGELGALQDFADAWLMREGLTLSPEQMRESVEKEIEAQHIILRRIEEVRDEPDATLLSHLVHTVIPEWGRPLNTEELMAEVSLSTIVAGLTTTTHALANGIHLLLERPGVWEELKADPERIDGFVEEALRLESPVQGLLRRAKVDVELHGVRIPAGGLVNVRFGSGNRDERQFFHPDDVDLARKRPRSHLAFGVGAHVCLGQGLARLELQHSFRSLVDRLDRIWLLEGSAVERPMNFLVRTVKELHLGFEPSGTGA
jgi:cytochrome P450